MQIFVGDINLANIYQIFNKQHIRENKHICISSKYLVTNIDQRFVILSIFYWLQMVSNLLTF